MKFIFALIMTAFSVNTFAAPKPCENIAKASAIRAYKAEVGTVQGSDGIQYTATLTGVRNDSVSYLISISDNNEDGETWTVSYSVALQISAGCKVLRQAKLK